MVIVQQKKYQKKYKKKPGTKSHPKTEITCSKYSKNKEGAIFKKKEEEVVAKEEDSQAKEKEDEEHEELIKKLLLYLLSKKAEDREEVMEKLKEVQDVPSLIDEEDEDVENENENGECQPVSTDPAESEDEFDDKHCTNISTGTVKSEHEETGEYVIEEQFQHTSTNADPDIESSTSESIEYEELDAKDQPSGE